MSVTVCVVFLGEERKGLRQSSYPATTTAETFLRTLCAK